SLDLIPKDRGGLARPDRLGTGRAHRAPQQEDEDDQDPTREEDPEDRVPGEEEVGYRREQGHMRRLIVYRQASAVPGAIFGVQRPGLTTMSKITAISRTSSILETQSARRSGSGPPDPRRRDPCRASTPGRPPARGRPLPPEPDDQERRRGQD